MRNKRKRRYTLQSKKSRTVKPKAIKNKNNKTKNVKKNQKQ
jgi:hypothetical protein